MSKRRNVLVSDSGVIHGHGTEPYKWVSGLTDAEREAVQRGDLVFIRDYGASHYTQSGWKVVHFAAGKYFHREPSEAQRRAFNQQFNRKGGNE